VVWASATNIDMEHKQLGVIFDEKNDFWNMKQENCNHGNESNYCFEKNCFEII
jgi:hypothetical protein